MAGATVLNFVSFYNFVSLFSRRENGIKWLGTVITKSKVKLVTMSYSLLDN